VKAIILAAGRGSRMQSLTDEKPKCLVELGGRTLLDRQLQALREGGVDEIGIVTGYRRELLADRGLVEFHNPRWAGTNMVASLACAGAWLSSGPCLVSYSDIFYGPRIVAAMAASRADIAVAYDPDWLPLWTRRFGDPLLDAETFRLDGERVLEIGNKPTRLEEIQGQYMGLLGFNPRGWAALEDLRAALPGALADQTHMTGMLQRLIGAGVAVHAVANGEAWGEIDSESDLQAYAGTHPTTPPA
jgi:choline kinase